MIDPSLELEDINPIIRKPNPKTNPKDWDSEESEDDEVSEVEEVEKKEKSSDRSIAYSRKTSDATSFREECFEIHASSSLEAIKTLRLLKKEFTNLFKKEGEAK